MNKPERPLQEHVNPDGTFMYIPITVVIGPDVTIGIRTQFLGRVTIGAGCIVGHDALIGHEAIIGEHSHVTPNAVVPRYWRIPAQSIVNQSEGHGTVVLPRHWPK